LAAQYLSVGESTIRDYLDDGLLRVVPLPGSTLRDRNGTVKVHAKNHKIAKILIDKTDLDAFIEARKARNERI
jgi:predicted site-specific integrase-resolvase